MEAMPIDLLVWWNTYVLYAALFFFAVGVGVFLLYEFRLLFLSDNKQRYDLVATHEINYLWYTTLGILAGIFLYVNTVVDETVWLAFFARLVVSLVSAVAIAMLLQYVFKFYYPFYVEKRLKLLRYRPRTSPDGRKMKLLSEEEEDIFLDEGMQAEEDIYSVDYDVWVDEVSGFVRLERYYGRFHAGKCSECQYLTMRFQREEITTQPTMNSKGEIQKYYSCSYCGYERTEKFSLAMLKKQQEYEAHIKKK